MAEYKDIYKEIDVHRAMFPEDENIFWMLRGKAYAISVALHNLKRLIDAGIKVDGKILDDIEKSIVKTIVDEGDYPGCDGAFGLAVEYILSNPRIDYHVYITSDEWKAKAKAAKQRAGNRCQLCNKSKDEIQLHAHHRTYERLGHEEDSDLIVLCANCHAKFHDKD